MAKKLESKFKKDFIDRLKTSFPDIKMFEPDPVRRRSDPDILLLGPDSWAALEFKREEKSSRQPNQEYRIEELARIGKDRGYSNLVSPENSEEVLDDLERLFST